MSRPDRFEVVEQRVIEWLELTRQELDHLDAMTVSDSHADDHRDVRRTTLVRLNTLSAVRDMFTVQKHRK